MKKVAGFTLIEMMLVVTLMAALAAFGVMIYHKHASSVRIEKAALEMQQVLEAALAYHADYSKLDNPTAEQPVWPQPTKNESLPCSVQDEEAPFIKYYLPNHQTMAAYGDSYCWDQGNFDSDVQKHSAKFWVAMHVPSKKMGDCIAAKLPSARVTSDPRSENGADCAVDSSKPCYVKAEVVELSSLPGGSGDGGVAGIGYCRPNGPDSQPGSSNKVLCDKDPDNGAHYKILVQCPVGRAAKVVVAPNFIQTVRSSGAAGDYSINHLASGPQLSQGASVGVVCAASSSSHQNYKQCDVYLDGSVGGHSEHSGSTIQDFYSPKKGYNAGYVGCSYLAICEKAEA